MNFHGTTILAVRHKGKAAVAGDGQVTLNNTVVKHQARKVRRIYNDKIIVGFAGATADALNLSERLEQKLERYNGNLTRSAVELARDWRTDKYLRRLEAIMIAVDEDSIYLISGNGDIIEPDKGIVAIGSGGVAAQAAATALRLRAEQSIPIKLRPTFAVGTIGTGTTCGRGSKRSLPMRHLLNEINRKNPLTRIQSND